jgi:hypothetical protein
MHSVEILPYQTGKLSAPAFQNGAAQDHQTKSAEPVPWNVFQKPFSEPFFEDSGRICRAIAEFSANSMNNTVEIHCIVYSPYLFIKPLAEAERMA